MSEPSLERLSRFTPDAGALDRDTLLYEAGRASARPNRGWVALAAALAATQALTLALLWPAAAPPVVVPHPRALPLPPPPGPPELLTDEQPSVSPGLWSARHNFRESEPEDPPAPAGALIENEPPLRALATPPPSILN